MQFHEHPFPPAKNQFKKKKMPQNGRCHIWKTFEFAAMHEVNLILSRSFKNWAHWIFMSQNLNFPTLCAQWPTKHQNLHVFLRSRIRSRLPECRCRDRQCRTSWPTEWIFPPSSPGERIVAVKLGVPQELMWCCFKEKKSSRKDVVCWCSHHWRRDQPRNETNTKKRSLTVSSRWSRAWYTNTPKMKNLGMKKNNKKQSDTSCPLDFYPRKPQRGLKVRFRIQHIEFGGWKWRHLRHRFTDLYVKSAAKCSTMARNKSIHMTSASYNPNGLYRLEAPTVTSCFST